MMRCECGHALEVHAVGARGHLFFQASPCNVGNCNCVAFLSGPELVGRRKPYAAPRVHESAKYKTGRELFHRSR